MKLLQNFEELTEIKAEVDRRGKLLGSVADHELPTYGYSDDSARPHIEVDAWGYHFVVAEWGQEQAQAGIPPTGRVARTNFAEVG